ncbi:MAG: NAD-dependent malic enzyme [Sandaracinus sp.]|nr:NAD-dependent malic enzyme [Sandaracinus sp.]|tara:strand:+ start:646 stop:2385 length:1740 start_codon:yes stop_codon:yes gene_type:complete
MPLSPYFDLKKDSDGNRFMEVYLDGIALLRLVLTNKGTAFTQEERISLKLEGLLPPRVETLADQVKRVYVGFKRQYDDIERYQYLRNLQERQEILFYALLVEHLEEMLPIVYTPTVGKAVQRFSDLYQNPRGLSFSPINIDRAVATTRSYPMGDVRMIVVTDASAILGIGDQGYGGLAIPIGKLALYTAGGGVSPFHTMPVALDVGTERVDLISDPRYLGVRQRRIHGEDYDDFLDKFVAAIEERWPRAIVQWEDLAKGVAFRVLERYRDRIPSFNDDIQGTGAVALAGVLSACARKGEPITEQTVVVHGAGAGGVGVAAAIVEGMVARGLDREAAHRRVLVLDSRGLLVEGRERVDDYKRPFAQPREVLEQWGIDEAPGLEDTIRLSGAGVLLGLSGQPGCFTQSIVEAVAANAERPVVFPLSNPTESCEAAPAEILQWTGGKALVATGSPFAPVEMDGRTFPIGQGNNAFIFPGLGFGAILSEASRVTDGMVAAAADALFHYTEKRYLADGLIYPPMSDLQAVSKRVAGAVIRQAIADGVCRHEGLEEVAADDQRLIDHIEERFWVPFYEPFVRGRS